MLPLPSLSAERSAGEFEQTPPHACTHPPLEPAVHLSHGEVSLHPCDPGKSQGSPFCLQENLGGARFLVPRGQQERDGRWAPLPPARTGRLKSGV